MNEQARRGRDGTPGLQGLAERHATLALVLAIAGAAACEGASSATLSSSRYVDASPPTVGQGGGTSSTSGLPCDVAQVLGSYCLSCHGDPPAQGVPLSLVSYGDLTATSSVDPAVTVAQRAVVRMQDGAAPMPPGSGATVPAADVATVRAWIDAGLPVGDCGVDAGTNPFDAPPVCSSGQIFAGGEEAGALMHPGRACIACHLQNGEGEAPIFSIAGTVYPTAHEPNDCVAAGITDAVVEIRDASGHTHDLPANASGNFTYVEAGFAYPYAAKVIYQGRERVMNASQMSGDCNGCHTQNGSQGAPGRILLP